MQLLREFFFCQKLLLASASAGLREFWSRKGSSNAAPRVRHSSFIVFAKILFWLRYIVVLACAVCFFVSFSGVFFCENILLPVCKSFAHVGVREKLGLVGHIVAFDLVYVF